MPKQRGASAAPKKTSGPGRAPKVVDTQLRREFEHVVADAVKEATEIHQVALEKLAPHPYNPRRRHENIDDKLTELADGIKALGMLEPMLVASVDAVVAQTPEIDRSDFGEDVEYVIVAGHRRWAASKVAEVATAPVVVRDDLADPVIRTEASIQENHHRDEFSPVEEARAFGRLRDAGQSQRQIASGTGYSQGHVQKQLRLLELPDEALQLLENEEITVTDARRLLELPDSEAMNEALHIAQSATGQALGDAIDRTVRMNLIRLQKQAQADKVRVLLSERGVTIVEDPDDRFDSAEDHEIGWAWIKDAAEDLDQVLAEVSDISCAAYDTNTGQVTFYTDTIPEQEDENQDTGNETVVDHVAEQRAKIEEWQQQRGVEGDRRAAAAARIAAQLTKIKRTDLNAIKDAGLLTSIGTIPGGKLWLQIAGEQGNDDLQTIAKRVVDSKDRARYAFAYALAALEKAVRAVDARPEWHNGLWLDHTAQPWPQVVRDYVGKLVELGGHEPSEHEAAQLARTLDDNTQATEEASA